MSLLPKVMSLQTLTNTNSQKLPWVEKYRPLEIENIVSHTEIIKTLKNFISLKTFPHLFFYGPSGTGKTSTIISCANALYGIYVNFMVLQLNASYERGIKTVRTKIKNFISNNSRIYFQKEITTPFKLVILDEIDSMTVEAQGMLRQTIEKNSATTRFCLICNDIDKINIALQSRCALFRFVPLDQISIRKRLHYICEKEGVCMPENCYDAVIEIANGDLRLAINMIHHASLSPKIERKAIYEISGHCIPENIDKIFDVLLKIYKKGINLQNGYGVITYLIIDNNITIFNLLDGLKNNVIAGNFSSDEKIFLLENFAEIEVYDSVNVDFKITTMIIVGLFVLLGEHYPDKSLIKN